LALECGFARCDWTSAEGRRATLAGLEAHIRQAAEGARKQHEASAGELSNVQLDIGRLDARDRQQGQERGKLQQARLQPQTEAAITSAQHEPLESDTQHTHERERHQPLQVARDVKLQAKLKAEQSLLAQFDQQSPTSSQQHLAAVFHDEFKQLPELHALIGAEREFFIDCAASVKRAIAQENPAKLAFVRMCKPEHEAGTHK